MRNRGTSAPLAVPCGRLLSTLDNRRNKSETYWVLFDDSPASSLTGIARLAARSPVLEAKSQVQYFEIETRSVLNRTKPGMPFRWTINPYRGCEFACRYCYARYTHEFMGIEDVTRFENQIF